jgi:hypothetical protein
MWPDLPVSRQSGLGLLFAKRREIDTPIAVTGFGSNAAGPLNTNIHSR